MANTSNIYLIISQILSYFCPSNISSAVSMYRDGTPF
jgi:hypothetical protein